MSDGSGSMRAALPYRLSVSREQRVACRFIAEIIETTPQGVQRCPQNLYFRSLAASLMCCALVCASKSTHGHGCDVAPGQHEGQTPHGATIRRQ